MRGHQVRKQYKKVVWSVSIVEKAILRWRRRGSGLRGFRVGNSTANVASENEKTDEYEFLRIGRKQKFAGVEKALERVKSMVRNPEARDQYMRMVAKFENFKVSSILIFFLSFFFFPMIEIFPLNFWWLQCDTQLTSISSYQILVSQSSLLD